MASLWTVGDEPTRALMSRFYENLWSRGLTAQAPLWEAQLHMLREARSHPTRGGDRRGGAPLDRDRANARLIAPYHRAAFVLSTDRP